MFTSVLRIEAQEEVLMPFPRTVSNQINIPLGIHKHLATCIVMGSLSHYLRIRSRPVWMCAHWMSRSDGASDSRGSPATQHGSQSQSNDKVPTRYRLAYVGQVQIVPGTSSAASFDCCLGRNNLIEVRLDAREWLISVALRTTCPPDTPSSC